MAEHLVEVDNLKMYFKKATGIVKRKTAYIKAVDNISFTIDKGETFGLVGESGCGKTTTGRTIIRLYDPTDGTIRYDGQDVTHLSPKEFMPYRKRMQMIFQDPYASLNARMTVSDIVGEPLAVSYTHLDVYKRQTQRCPLRDRPFRLRRSVLSAPRFAACIGESQKRNERNGGNYEKTQIVVRHPGSGYDWFSSVRLRRANQLQQQHRQRQLQQLPV